MFFLPILVGLLFACGRAADQAQQCSTEKAEPCLISRKGKFNSTMQNYLGGTSDARAQFVELGPQMCLTQIRHDQDGRCFETNTELCGKDQAKDLKQQWNELNGNITQMCQEVCPNFLQIASCKNQTVTDELRDSRFEKFCSSFNESLMCATHVLSDCEFGMHIYYSALEQQIMPYWRQICNSGCSNIDQTVGVIKTCAKPLKSLGSKPPLEDLCNAHYNFKKCVFGSSKICQEEVMELIKFMYRKYYKIDAACTTTTATTTTSTTTTEELSTSQSFSSDSVTSKTLTSDSLTSQSVTSDLEITETTNGTSTFGSFISESTTDKLVTGVDTSSLYSSCISTETIEKMTADDDLTVSKALAMMQLEACIYRNLSSTDHDSPETVSQHHIPRALRELFKSYKASGYQLIIDAMTEMAKCEENVPSGCTGHRYGLIECEPSGAGHCSMALVFKILPLIILYHIIS